MKRHLSLAVSLVVVMGTVSLRGQYRPADRSEGEALCIHGKVAAAGAGAPVYQALVSCGCDGRERAQAATSDTGAFSACTSTDSRLFYRATTCECSVRAAGYRTVQDIRVDARTGQAGTILLQPLAKAEGASISVSTLQAPPDARKEYEKGVAESRKRKWKSAGEHLAKAVALHPKYAIAWYELGQVYLARNDKEQARLAFEQAISIDKSFVRAYLPLASISFEEGKWNEVLGTIGALLRLDPPGSPLAHMYSAVANLNTGNLPAAEKNARDAVRLDRDRRLPKAEHVLGLVLAQMKDYRAAAEHFRIYLALASGAPDAAEVRTQLRVAEQRAVTTTQD